VIFPQYIRIFRVTFVLIPFLIVVGGCAGPAPKSLGLPTEESRAGDIVQRRFDTNADGKIDYWQELATSGRIEVLQFDTNADGLPDLNVDRSRLLPTSAPSSDSGDIRNLIVLLDSVPFGMVQEAWRQGHFRLFYPPRRTISPFPVMTDLSFSELFGCSPSPGVEASYYDGHKLLDGYGVYASGGNIRWSKFVDYELNPLTHVVAYLQPFTWYLHELGKIQRHFLKGHDSLFIGYSVGTSAVGAHFGRDGHQKALIRVDQFCEYIMHQTRGRTQITLLSDHGHNMVHSRRIPLSDLLEEAGYHPVKHGPLRAPNDIAVPEFGVINCAAIHTLRPAAVAHDVVGFEGVELTAYMDVDGSTIVVLSRDGRAQIRRSPDGRFGYVCQFGDPLRMSQTWEELRKQGKLDPEGFAVEADVFAATNSAAYPDPCHRLWRAFHGLVEHTPDVYVSVQDGYHCGSALMTKMVEISSAHGGLGYASSSGFVMTTAGELPEVMRMEDLGAELRKIGVPIRKDDEHKNVGSPN
jgi:hypothetical protein